MIPNRFASVYKKDSNRVPILYINPSVLFWFGCIPPSVGTVLAISTALIFHQDKITNYKWTCGRAFLPSFSRIINLDFEGLFWQLFVYYHIPLRLVELAVGVIRYDRLRLPSCRFPRFYNFCRLGYFISGVFELVFIIGLSAVGEKENGLIHVIFFYTFGIFTFLFFSFNTICHSQSLWYLNPYGRISYKVKVTVCILYFISVPMIVGFYLLYWTVCITLAYELFALTEYFDALISMIFHACTLWDIRYKVIFRLDYTPINRRSHPTKGEEIELKNPEKEQAHETDSLSSYCCTGFLDMNTESNNFKPVFENKPSSNEPENHDDELPPLKPSQSEYCIKDLNYISNLPIVKAFNAEEERQKKQN